MKAFVSTAVRQTHVGVVQLLLFTDLHSMCRAIFFLFSLIASNTGAFVVPPGPRRMVGNIGKQDHLASVRQPSSAFSARSAPIMRYVAMNRFKVKLGCEEEFETMWRWESVLALVDLLLSTIFRPIDGIFDALQCVPYYALQQWPKERESKLASFSGFQEFMLLRLDSDDQERGEGGSTASKAGYAEFISHTTWAHKLDYLDWKNSQAFKKSHSKDGKPSAGGTAGGMSKMGDLIVERPSPALFDAVIVEPTPPEHMGGLFEFENEPSYFDGDL